MEFVEHQPLDGLQYDPANPRNHSEKNLNAIRSSLEEHGQVEPLIVHKETSVVIGGNARLSVMRKLGFEEAAVIMLDCDENEARRLSIVLNRTGELAGWDTEVLAKHMMNFQAEGDFDPEVLGFSANEFEAILAEFDQAIESVELDAPGELERPDIPEFDDAEAGRPGANVRMVQLFLDDETQPMFVGWARILAEHYGTKTMTDTVFKAVQDIVSQLDESAH